MNFKYFNLPLSDKYTNYLKQTNKQLIIFSQLHQCLQTFWVGLKREGENELKVISMYICVCVHTYTLEIDDISFC
jgi:hypothetical protein